MASITVSRAIEAPPETVFETLTDIGRWSDHISGIERVEMLTDGPVGVGTRFRETRIMFKREATEEMEITAFDAPRSYTLTCESCGARYVTETRVTPEGSGSLVVLDMRVTPVTTLAKIMSPLGAIFSGPLKKCLLKDLEDLDRHLTAPGAAAATA